MDRTDRSILLAEIDRALSEIQAPAWGRIMLELAIMDGRVVRVDTNVRHTRILREECVSDPLDETTTWR
jgi:hypothetical protein